MTLKYLSSKSAALLDQLLMQPRGPFTLAQLMELAGLAVAQCAARVFPPSKYKKVTVFCGPGNQGGDGLVAARHLYHFGYSPTIIYPKQGKNAYYSVLVEECKSLHLPFVDYSSGIWENTDLTVDAIFGFSFEGEPRPPFNVILQDFAKNGRGDLTKKTPVLSVDIPSGWDVDKGNLDPPTSFEPDLLISLTAPKTGSLDYKGKHWLGGRFVPPFPYQSQIYKLN
ncbi:YjeF N-terminal domain-like protein [Atractiella rhizophila]|nr:YjeF N-terminal domain-like protein [Atractiella rhizophila]